MTDKIGYLTIDDAPTSDFRNKIDFLSSHNISAIFFCVGNKIESQKLELIRAIQKGFIIGNHSWSHSDFNKLSQDEIKNEIIKTDELINNLYKFANVHRDMKLFRFPFLSKGIAHRKFTQELLKKLGYEHPFFSNIQVKQYHHLPKDIDISCTYDTKDWAIADKTFRFGIKTLEDVLERMDRNNINEWETLSFRDSNDIILMHDDIKIKELFQPMIKKIISKNIQLRLPSPIYK